MLNVWLRLLREHRRAGYCLDVTRRNFMKLEANDVHVWLVKLDRQTAVVERIAARRVSRLILNRWSG
jgi:hypothetical protein